MAYKVLADFVDKLTGKVYRKGDEFPLCDAARMRELSGKDNARGYPLIAEEKSKAEEKPVAEKKPAAKRKK